MSTAVRRSRFGVVIWLLIACGAQAFGRESLTLQKQQSQTASGACPSPPGPGPMVWLVDKRTNPNNNYDINAVAAALKAQANGEFSAAWGRGVQDVKVDSGVHNAPDWVIYLVDQSSLGLGYHDVGSDQNGQDQVEGFVSASAPYSGWPITASHELLEMLGDPLTNTCDSGYRQEVGDPVENSAYTETSSAGAIPVSDFVYPSWFGLVNGPQDRYDYLGKAAGPHQIGSDGGYISYCSQSGGMQIGEIAGPYPPGIFRSANGAWNKNPLSYLLLGPQGRLILKQFKGKPASHQPGDAGFVIGARPTR